MSGAADGADDDAVWRRDEIESPCQKICMIHPGAKICIGCGRTPEEIAGWSRFDAAERARIAAELPGRAARLRAVDARPSRRRARRRDGGEGADGAR